MTDAPPAPLSCPEEDDPNPLEPVKTPVTAYATQVILEDLFPGATVHKTQRIGGVVYKVRIWRYYVEVSVTKEAMTEVDSKGDATFTFYEQERGRGPGSKPVLLKQFTTGDLGVLRDAIESAKEHLLGIIFAIDLVCNHAKPGPKPADIFEEGEEG